MPLTLPNIVTVRLKLADGQPLPLANVILRIDTFATRKNDISLFPFSTDECGIARITKEEMEAEVSATYDSGLMDYASIESAEALVEIRVCGTAEIERAIAARTGVWNTLLRGEERRWKKIDDLIALLRSATNAACEDPEAKVRGSWDKAGAQYEFEIRVRKMG
jgi:hypothetical protein